MNWTAVGLALDFFGVLFLAVSSVGWRRSRGYQSPGSWITEGWPSRWLERRGRGRDAETVRVAVNRLGWSTLLAGFALQFVASVTG